MIVRHGKVNMKWPKMCSSEDFDKACAEYDRSDLESINIIPLDEPADRIYVSKLLRSANTARILFPNKEYYEVLEIGEVPLKSFMDTKKRLRCYFFTTKGGMKCHIKLVIAEKPSVAQSIAKVIGADKREDRYLEARRRNQNDK